MCMLWYMGCSCYNHKTVKKTVKITHKNQIKNGEEICKFNFEQNNYKFYNFFSGYNTFTKL